MNEIKVSPPDLLRGRVWFQGRALVWVSKSFLSCAASWLCDLWYITVPPWTFGMLLYISNPCPASQHNDSISYVELLPYARGCSKYFI